MKPKEIHVSVYFVLNFFYRLEVLEGINTGREGIGSGLLVINMPDPMPYKPIWMPSRPAFLLEKHVADSEGFQLCQRNQFCRKVVRRKVQPWE